MAQTRRPVAALAMVALLLGAFGGAARAQEGQPLTLAPLTSGRIAALSTLNGTPVQVCQSIEESYNRTHGTCQDLATVEGQFEAGRVIESITYDDKYYQRVNQETTWTVMENVFYDPQAVVLDNITTFPAYAGPHTMIVIGPATVNGVATTQYQFWSTDAEVRAALGQAKLDLFVSADGTVHKVVFSADVPEGAAAFTVVLTEQNVPQKVYPPDASLVRAAGLNAMGLSGIAPSAIWR
jgi:hypothetical protein